MDARLHRRRLASRTALIALGVVTAVLVSGLTTPTAVARPLCDQPKPPPICGGGDPRHPLPPPPPKPVVATFSWSVPERLRLSPRNTSYVPVDVTPDKWPVDLNACGSSGGIDGMLGYHWSIDGVPVMQTGNCATRLQLPRLGTYSVDLTVVGAKKWGGLARSSTVQTVEVRDLLVVSLGDSIASGEGNPDVREKIFHDADWESERCHRSRVSGPTQTALALERRDPHSSVTFIHLACSGAAIIAGSSGDGGLLRPYGGVLKYKPTPPPLPSQLDAASTRAEGRQIDALLISAGANDVGFAAIVTGCLDGPSGGFKRNPRYDCSDPQSVVRTRAEEAIAQRLPGLYDQLAQKVEARLHPRRVLITEYPDVTRNKNGDICDPLMETPAGKVSRAEAQWAYDRVITGMNQAIAAAAARNPAAGWEVVSLGDAFSRGDYCSNQGRLIRTLSESSQFQWDVGGSMHPNAGGHTAISQRILARFDAPPAGDNVLPKPAEPPAAVATGRLVVSQPLTVTLGAADQPTTASFTVTNAGGQTLAVPYLLVGARGADGANVDFPASSALTLQPGTTHTYRQSKQLPLGKYTAWPAYYDGTTWTELSARQNVTVPPAP